MLDAHSAEFTRYRQMAEKAIAQTSDDGLNRVPFADGNSIAMLVRHISGNFKSRFTDFLESDGEKPWRNRDAEFEDRVCTRDEVEQMWTEGWAVLDDALAGLSEADMARTVRIRGQEWSVDEALARSVAHLAYHVGQIVWLARLDRQADWDWITIPKGGSAAYNANPTLDRGFDTQESGQQA